jgi:hypothetical protein
MGLTGLVVLATVNDLPLHEGTSGHRLDTCQPHLQT